MKLYGPKELADLIPYPSYDANKYSRGRCVLIGGSLSYPGAISLAALASQRMGAGYTEVYTDMAVVGHVQAYHPSLVVRSWSTWDTAMLPASTTRKPCAYVIGCGFDLEDPLMPSLVRRILKNIEAPVLVDGSALRILSARKMRTLSAQRFKAKLPTIITPHMGEANALAAIFGLSTREPDELCLQLAQAYGVYCVLKGPDTYISDGEETLVMREGSAALAKAGTGDVLAGMIGALLAQGMEIMDACVLGTSLHARSALCALEDVGEVSLIAEDVINYIPAAIKNLHTEGLHASSTTREEALLQAAVSSAMQAELTGPYYPSKYRDAHDVKHIDRSVVDELEGASTLRTEDQSEGESLEDLDAKKRALESLEV